MKILLDTHIFLWFISGDNRLSAPVRDAIRDRSNEVYLSVASVWEAVIKHQLGKLPLPKAPEIYLPEQRRLHQIESLSIDEDCMRQLASLPTLHKDPFDRLLISQAKEYGMILATVDPMIKAYAVSTL
jgi:PIN domain nuclease of toxin-antitoxin system